MKPGKKCDSPRRPSRGGEWDRLALVAALACLTIAACAAPPQPSPTAAEPIRPAEKPAEKAAAKADPAAQWEQTVAAAKQEGRVVIAAGANVPPSLRGVYTESFEAQFPQIKVDMTVLGGAELGSRLLTERQAGRYLWDVFVGGTTTALELLIPAGVLDPIRPALVLPEVTDRGKWLGGDYDFADDAGTHNLVFAGYVKSPLAINPQLTRKEDLRSYHDLLDPKWRGKIIMQDPRVPGSGLAGVTFWYGTPGLGPEFIQRFFAEQTPRLSRDARELLEAVARGEFLIGLAHSESFLVELQGRGLPLQDFAADDLLEGSYLTPSVGSVGAINRPPDPNAARVFINWLLTQDTQRAWSRATTYPSRRVDVSTDHISQANVPKPGKTYQLNYKEEWVKKKEEISELMKKVFQ